MKIEQAIKQSGFQNSYQKAVINIIYTGNWLRDVQSELLKQYDILPQHYNVLRIIKGRYPEAISPGEIKEVMLDKGNDVTRLADKLFKKGFIKRQLCKNNRRKIDIHITEKGLAFLKNVEEPIKKSFLPMKKKISEKEAELLSELLDKIRI